MTFSRAVVSARIEDGWNCGLETGEEVVEESLLLRPAARDTNGRVAEEHVEKRAAREARRIERDKGRKSTIVTD